MSMELPPDTSLALILSLDENTREIDQTFATVGDRLGQGLAIFETLDARLGAMSGELVGSDMDGTRDALRSVVRDLRIFSDGLPGENRILQEIARHSDDASQFFDRLIDHIRLISAVACSARIEAAQVQSSRRGDDYFDEISALVGLAKQTIETCAHNHHQLKILLVSAIEAQRHFATSYGPTLAALASRLDETLRQIENRRQRSVTLTADAALQSRKIADAVSGAIIALQCGDSTRQRLEHSLSTLRLAGGVANDTCAEAGLLSDGDRAVLATLLKQLVACQLRATADTMAEDVLEIDQALSILAGDMAATTDLGRSLYGGEDPAASSFLSVLEAELSQASELLGKCNAARIQMDGVTNALMAFVEQFRNTAVSLSETVCNIVLIGMNSGLHASRLGNDGRGLVVIAHELKAVADQIVRNAARLSPIFDLMQASAAEMKTRNVGRAVHLAALDDTMRHSLSWMKESGSRLQATLDELIEDSSAFAAAVEDARHSFSGASAAADMISDTAGKLHDGPTGLPATLAVNDRVLIEAFLEQYVWPTYTMMAERQLHIAALDACKMSATTQDSPKPAYSLDTQQVAA